MVDPKTLPMNNPNNVGGYSGIRVPASDATGIDSSGGLSPDSKSKQDPNESTS